MTEPKRRGRKPNNKTPEQAAVQGLDVGNDRDPNKSTRPPRSRMGGGKRLSVPEKYVSDPNYYYRWILDDVDRPGRIHEAEKAYYEKVNDDNGSPITRSSGVSTLFLMRLPMKYREEDLAVKREKVRMRNKTESQLSENEYAPTEKGAPEGGKEMLRKQSVSDNPFAEG